MNPFEDLMELRIKQLAHGRRSVQHKYLLGTLEVPGIVLGTGGLEMNKTLFSSSLLYLRT